MKSETRYMLLNFIKQDLGLAVTPNPSLGLKDKTETDYQIITISPKGGYSSESDSLNDSNSSTSLDTTTVSPIMTASDEEDYCYPAYRYLNKLARRVRSLYIGKSKFKSKLWVELNPISSYDRSAVERSNFTINLLACLRSEYFEINLVPCGK
jgi:hypothetical protein